MANPHGNDRGARWVDGSPSTGDIARAVTDEGSSTAEIQHIRNYVWDGVSSWVRETQPGGSGSGGAVTIIDGGDVAQGTTTDTSAANTVVGILKAIKANTGGGGGAVNLTGINGVVPDVSSGNKSTGTLRVTLATDQVQLTNALKVDGSAVTQPVSIAATVTVADNQTIVDNAAFTDGTSKVLMGGFVFDEVAGTALTENDAAAARIDSKRAIVHVIEDATTRGQRAAVSAGGALSVALAANQSVNVAQLAGTATSVNSGTKDAGTLRVTLATDQVQLTNALKVDGSAVTQPVSLATGGGKTLAFASVSTAASGQTAIVAADGTRKIKVVSYVLVADAAVAVKWQNASTDLTGAMSLAANGGVSAIGSPNGHLMETSVNQALNLNLGSAVGVRGHISYFLE